MGRDRHRASILGVMLCAVSAACLVSSGGWGKTLSPDVVAVSGDPSGATRTPTDTPTVTPTWTVTPTIPLGYNSEVISSNAERYSAVHSDPDIDIISFHSAGSVQKVDDTFDNNNQYGKPILISDDGQFWSMATPVNMKAALDRAMQRGGHFEHLDLDITDRECFGQPVSGIEHFTPRSIKNLEYLSQHGQSLPYPGKLTHSGNKLYWNGQEIHLVGFASYNNVATPVTDIDGYLDVLADTAAASDRPVWAYQVSGEYAMVEAAAANGWLDRTAVVAETLLSIRRAGADAIVTYWATEFAEQAGRD